MSLPLPWTFSRDDPAGKELEDRLQDVFDAIGKQFPVSITNVSQVPQARVYNSAALTITTATLTALTFNSERWDTASLHDVAVNTSRLTANIAGLFSISGHAAWAAAAAGTYRYAAIRLNGATIIAEQVKQPAANNSQTSVGTQYRLAVGDYVELVVQQDSGGNLNVLAVGNASPEFSMHWVSP